MSGSPATSLSPHAIANLLNSASLDVTASPSPAPGAPLAAPAVTELRVETFLEPAQTPPMAGQPFRASVKVSWRGDPGAVAVSAPVLPSREGLTLVRTETRTASGLEQGQPVSEEIYTYTLVAGSAGLVTLGPVEVACTVEGPLGRKVLQTAPFPVTVGTPPVALWRHPVFRSGLAVAALGLLAVAGRQLVRRRRRLATPEEPAPPPPEVAAREALRQAQRLRMEGDFSGYHSAIARVLREFVAQRYHLAVRDLTTAALAERLRQVAAGHPEWVRQVVAVLERCDAVRFTPQRPTEQELDSLSADAERCLHG